MKNKIKELIKKYDMFLKYIFVAIISFLIDITLFYLLELMLIGKIIIATIIARVISSFINYLLNKNRVFKSEEKNSRTVIKYYLLVIIQMFISALLVKILYNRININPTIIKVPVDLFIFVCNYLIQKKFIFKKK